MSTVMEEYALITGSVEVDEMVERDDSESVDAALAEINLRLARISVEKTELLTRRGELLSGKQEMRRRRARTELDRFQLPVVFVAIEEVEES